MYSVFVPIILLILLHEQYLDVWCVGYCVHNNTIIFAFLVIFKIRLQRNTHILAVYKYVPESLDCTIHGTDADKNVVAAFLDTRR